MTNERGNPSHPPVADRDPTVAQHARSLPSGSYLVIGHAASDMEPGSPDVPSARKAG